MILSASRRTDIPAFHADWFFNRLREGFLLVRNSDKDERYYRVSLVPELVDCIVFRTKNPAPMLGRLEELRDYNYLFNVTMNPYGREMESGVPRLVERVETYKKLAGQIGPERMIWRYDPVMVSAKYNMNFHRRAFEYLTQELSPHSYKCMIGFIINHYFIAGRMAPMAINQRSGADIMAVGEIFGEISARHGQRLESCATEVSLNQFGISHGACIDREQIEQIVGYRFERVREKYLRPHCNCLESIEIGHYSTCANGCRYCYATRGRINTSTPTLSPSLDPDFSPSAPIAEAKIRSFRTAQRSLW